VCGGRVTEPAALARAAAVYRSVGMRPLELSAEVDGFVADRLLEALWREALWLVNDGAATVEEIDDAIRFGAGLRWSFMGTFLTYRIAGGEAGMRHFLEQFGPALQGLRAAGFGAGEVLADYERTLFGRSGTAGVELHDGQPLRIHERIVPTEWLDYNGHTNDSRYVQLSSEAVDAFLGFIGVDEAYLSSGRSYYTVESHVNYLGQTRAGDRLGADIVLLAHDEKRFHVFVSMYRQNDDGIDDPVATAEPDLAGRHVGAARAR
jgi:carnitine 3-dehydrogenase